VKIEVVCGLTGKSVIFPKTDPVMALSKEYVAFFKQLASNNNTEWFNANKKKYEEHVKKPFTELVQEVIERMKKLDPKIKLEPKDCIFRINRDIRFSADKSPYKNYMAAAVSRGGRKDHTIPGIYFHIEANMVSIAGGSWEPQKEDLLKIRKAIAKDPKQVNKILAAKKFADMYKGLGGEKYKIIPPEFKEAGAIAPVMYNKSFHYEKQYKGETNVTRKDLAQFIVSHYQAAEGWNDFLREALGKK
jgi:uncharacterized protein (TIGR02453 family)